MVMESVSPAACFCIRVPRSSLEAISVPSTDTVTVDPGTPVPVTVGVLSVIVEPPAGAVFSRFVAQLDRHHSLLSGAERRTWIAEVA